MKINQDIVVGIVCLAVAAVVFSITPSFPAGQEEMNLTGPAFFPNVLATMSVILGAIQVIVGLRKKHPEAAGETRPSTGRDGKKVAYFLVLVTGFVLCFEPLGFFVSTFIFLFFVMLLFGMTVPKSLLYTVVYTAVIYLLFGKLFVIGLPSGVLGALGL